MERRKLLRLGAIALTAGLGACVRRTSAPAGVGASAESDAPADEPTASERASNATPEPETVPKASPESVPTPDPAPGFEASAEPGPIALKVICRDSLGLLAAGASATAHSIGRITLHHTAVELGDNRHAPARLRGHQRYHLEQGWSDIAYHFGVDLRGNVYELRAPQWAGETFTDYDPAGHFLIVCEGDYDREEPSDTLLRSVAGLVAFAAEEYGVGIDTLSGHRDHATGISCPGDRLHRRLNEIRGEAGRAVAAGGRTLVSICGDVGRQRIDAIEAGEVS